MLKDFQGIKNRKALFLIVLLIFCVFSAGCSKIDDIKVSLGFKNTDFEYIKQGKIEKIVIQSTRDEGFRFIVTDKKAISELYDILSNAKIADTKSSLEPDYIFEMIEGNKVHKFSYVAGLDKKDSGNLYSDKKIYIVSKRIDNDIIKSFWTIRKPKDFNDVYYRSITDALSQYLEGKKNTPSVGITFKEDIEAAKFILSTDLGEFKNDLNDKFKGVNIANKDKENYDVWVTIKTQGYKSTLYKAIITFWDKNEKSEKKYYVFNKYENGRWSIKVSEKRPDNF